MAITGALSIVVRHRGATAIQITRDMDDRLSFCRVDAAGEHFAGDIGSEVAVSKRHALKIAQAILALYTGRPCAMPKD
jgi:hypothetical protein